MNKIYIVTLLIAVASACTPSSTSSSEAVKESKSKDQARDKLHQEVIAVHDIAMVKMQIIMNLKSASIKESDSLRQLGIASLAERIEQLEKSQLDLEEAYEAMMVWMREFKPPSDTVSHDTAIQYLKSEQGKVAEVNDRMDQVIANVKSL